MKLLNTFFVALFLLSTLVYLTGCDKTNTLVYTPVGRQYPANTLNITVPLYSITNGAMVITDADLTNSFGVTVPAYTDISFVGHLPGVPEIRDTIKGTFTFPGVADSVYHLTSDTNGVCGVLKIKNTDNTFSKYVSVPDGATNITINSYGILGEYINGTFSGRFSGVTASDTIVITNGQFSCYRRQ